MKLLDIFLGIIENPHIPRFYNELHMHYNKNNLQNEAEALRLLLKTKFHEKLDNSGNSTQ